MRRWTSEWLLLHRDRTAWLVYALFAFACAFAVADSVSTYRREASLQSALAREEAGRIEGLRQALSAPSRPPMPPWVDRANPGGVSRGSGATYALLPQSDLSVVRSRGVAATAVAVTADGGALDRAFGDLAQPHVQSLGHFDLGFLLLVVLPLVVLLLGFDVVARDHERGTLRLLLACEASPRSRYLTRVTMRVAPAIGMAFASVLVAVALVGRFSAAALPGLGAVLAAIALYTLFWASVSLVVQSRFRTASASGIVSLAAWAAFVVLVPIVLSASAEATTPIPSRIERTEASREAARRASIEAEGLLSRYLEDHPELAGTRANAGDYYMRRVAMENAVAAARAPVEQRFEGAVQHRNRLMSRMVLASPVSLFARMLDELAGSSDDRVDRFRHEVDELQSRFAAFFNAKTMRGESLSAASLAERPIFHFEEPPAAVWPLFVLGAWALMMFGLAMLRFRHSVDIEEASSARKPVAELEVSAA